MEYKCPFCNTGSKSVEDQVQDIRKWVAANDPASIFVLASYHEHGSGGLQQDWTKAMELYTRAADLGFSSAHSYLGNIYHEGGELKKAKFHYETAAMAGQKGARLILGAMEGSSGSKERAIQHLTIAASSGHYMAMHKLRLLFEMGRELIDSTLAA
jgi:TPR repeat protein